MPQMLGKRAAVFDKRTLKLRAYTTPELLEVPESSDWALKVGTTGPAFLNTKIGCCFIAMIANARRGWTANRSTMVDITDGKVLAEYKSLSGYDENAPLDRFGNNPTDTGCVMLDGLKKWRRDGICDGKLGAFASVHPTDRHMASVGVHIFGGLLMGVQLPRAVMGNDGDWLAPSVQSNLVGDWAPGTWGGHAIIATKYDPDWLYFWSWGQLRRMSWNFFHWYSDETYVAVSADWLGSDFTSPAGITMNQMLEDVGAIATAA